MSVVSLTKAEVPGYLVGSDFYNSLSSEDDEKFSIPRIHLKFTTEINNSEDLSHLLHTLQFWGLTSWPSELFAYLSTKRDDNVRTEEFLTEFDNIFHLSQLFRDLQLANSAQLQLDAAIKCGRKDVIGYFLHLGKVSKGMLIRTAAENGFVEILKNKFIELTAKGIHIPLPQVSLSAVATAGHADCLHFLLSHGCRNVSTVCLAAAENGHLECLKVAREFHCFWDGKVTNAAAQNGKTKCLEFALREGCPIGASATLYATKNNHMECLRLLLNSGAVKSTQLSYTAAVRGHLPCLQLLTGHNGREDLSCAREAASHGHLHCLQYLFDRGCPLKRSVADAATAGGRLNCLEYLYAFRGLRASSRGVRAAAERGHLDVLQFLHSRGAKLTLDTCAAAVRGCAIPCLQFCVEHNAPLDASLCVVAAERSVVSRAQSKELAMLRYLHEVVHCPWDARTCTAAVEGNRHDLLCYAHNHGCPWDIHTTNAAAQKDGGDFLKYMLQHGCPYDVRTCVEVAMRGNLACLRLLRERGCPWDERVSRAARRRPDRMCYCVQNGCPVDRETMDAYNSRIKYTRIG